MHNPWLQKNPWLSMWMSAANSMVGASRGLATAEIRRQMKIAQADMERQIVDFWTMKPLWPSPRKRSSRR
ncbi:hypothetical protein [Variovorax sp. KK3]|uniref:hypothetical protein n=1 Tax=Variovorax sp. KK3 TaxID=1855728 RepID=UPI00097C51AF|nr:hypothetical protein [Variovorax sp. KK3]